LERRKPLPIKEKQLAANQRVELDLNSSRGDPLFTEQNISVAEGEWKVA
jgi:hypothetical protein